MGIGDNVRVLEPFASAFPDVYPIVGMDGTTAFLGGIPEDYANAFDVEFLVLA